MFNRIAQKLRDRTGSSMLLVLAVTLLLLAVGGSALVAGSTAMGQVAAQRDFKQLELYTYSINDTILSALTNKDTDSLGKKLAMQFYQNAAKGDTVAALPTSLTLDITGYTLPAGLVDSITLYCTPDVRITPALPEIDVPGFVKTPRQPRTALVDATVEIVTVLKLNGRTVTSAATYRLSDAKLVDNGVSEDIMDFATEADSLGRWEMTKYEMRTSN